MKERLKSKFPGFFRTLKRDYYRLRRFNPFISSRFIYIGNGRYLDFKTKKSREIKPNLFIVGAEKSGTTSLHQLLDQHPDIFMSKPNKEPHYAMPLEFTVKYLAQSNMPVNSKNQVLRQHMLKGYQGQRYIGESTAAYTRGKISKILNTPRRIKQISPNAKIIYIVRNPFERLVSSHNHRLREGWTRYENLSEDVLNNPDMVETSRYVQQIDRFEQVFPGQLLILRLADLSNPKELSSMVAKFLGIDLHQFSFAPVLNRGHNKGDQNFDPKLFIKLKKIFSAEVHTLETRYKLNLSHWDLSPETWA